MPAVRLRSGAVATSAEGRDRLIALPLTGSMSMHSVGHDRREFMAKGFCFAASAGLAAFGVRPALAQAQSPPRPIRRSERYDDSFITERKAFKWPGNKTLAVWFAPNVEV